MSVLATIAVAAALLGSALIAGVFFAFSSFIMKALAELPSAEGISAMQSINVTVLNRSFLGTFFGTALLSLLVAVTAMANWQAGAPWYLAGALLYVCGTFLVTAFGNVPLNDQLAALETTGSAGYPVWQQYVDRWTVLNTIRTIAAGLAAFCHVAGLIASQNA
jgi:uncharacterized membrane protein